MTTKAVLGYVLPLIAFIAVASIFVLIWSYVIGFAYPPITFGPNLGYMKPPEGRAGDYVRLCRDMTVSRSVNVVLERTFTTNDYPDSGQLSIAMPAEKVSREAGRVSQCRILQIPYGTPTGNWRMHTWVTYESWPFWRYTIEAPCVGFKVIE